MRQRSALLQLQMVLALTLTLVLALTLALAHVPERLMNYLEPERLMNYPEYYSRISALYGDFYIFFSILLFSLRPRKQTQPQNSASLCWLQKSGSRKLNI